MTILNLIFIVFLGILFFIAYFHISNYILDTYGNKTLKRYNFENSIRVIVFITPAFIVLFIFILYPVFETIRLSFYDKFGREFVGLYNYKWAINDPEFRRSILNNYFNYFFIVTFTVLLILISAILKFRIYQIPLIISLIIIFFLTPYLNSFQKINEENYKSNNWLDFNSKSIPEIIANNEIIFLDITADWCITCKFNKINVLNSKTVSDFFDSQEVTLIKADWTQPNEKINKFLKKYNKFGIPFNAFYSSKFPEGVVMNEILTEKQIFETYNKVK